MADVKTIQTRLQLKYDTYANWTLDNEATQAAKTNANLVLLKGEIGICAIGDTAETGKAQATTNPTVLFKVGDGTTPFKDLKWASALAADVYAWAKSETVVFNADNKHVEFKTGETVNHYVDLSHFAEASTVADHSTRLTDIEAALGLEGGEGKESISTQIADIVERLGTIQGADTVEGSIAKALKDAKTYADNAVTTAVGNYVEGEEDTEGYKAASGLRKEIADAEAAAKAYTDEAVEAIEAKDAEQDKAITDEAKAREDADKAITDMIGTGFDSTETGTVAAKVKAAHDAADAAQDAADAAQDAVDALTADDGQVTKNTADIAQLGIDLAAETKAREDADKAINDKIGTKDDAATVDTVYGAIAAANAAASVADGKAVAAQNAVNALTDEDGQITVNTADIAQLKTDLATETTNRTNADNALDERLEKVEAFFEGAYTEDGKPVKEALDTLVEIQNLLSTEEGAAAGELLDAVTELKDIVGKEAEGENEATGLVKDAADAKADIADLKVDVAALQDVVDGYTTKGSVKTAIEAAAELAQQGVDDAKAADDKAVAADGKAVDAQNRVGELEGVVPGIKTTAEDAQTRVAALEPKVEQAEKDIDALEAIVKTGENTNAQLRADIEALEAIVVEGEDGNVKLGAEIDAIAAKVNNETTGLAATNTAATDAQTRVAALEPRVKTAEDAIVEITKTGGTIDIAKQAAIDAAATDASNKVAVALSEAQTHANNLNTAMDTRVDALETDVAAIKGDYLKAEDLFIFDCGSATEVVHVAPN